MGRFSKKMNKGNLSGAYVKPYDRKMSFFDIMNKEGIFDNILTSGLINEFAKQNSMFNHLFKGKLKGTYTNPVSDFNTVTDYGDSENSQELISEAINISMLQSSVKIAFLNEDINEIEKHLFILKKKMDYLLNKFPRIFASYGTWGAVYYNYKGILSRVEDELLGAKEDHIRGLIYECIYLARCVDLNNIEKIRAWSKDNLGNLNNYNLLVNEDEQIADYTSIIDYKDLANIFVHYMLFVIEKVGFSKFGAITYLTYIKNLLQIHYDNQDYHDLFDSKISLPLRVLEKSYEPLDSTEVDILLDTLKYTGHIIKGPNSIESIVDRFMGR